MFVGLLKTIVVKIFCKYIIKLLCFRDINDLNLIIFVKVFGRTDTAINFYTFSYWNNQIWIKQNKSSSQGNNVWKKVIFFDKSGNFLKLFWQRWLGVPVNKIISHKYMHLIKLKNTFFFFWSKSTETIMCPASQKLWSHFFVEILWQFYPHICGFFLKIFFIVAYSEFYSVLGYFYKYLNKNGAKNKRARNVYRNRYSYNWWSYV